MKLDDFRKLIRSFTSPLETRLANLVARAVVKLVTDSTKLQALQLAILTGEVRDGVERFQEYGLTSVPFADAEAVVLFVGGRRDHGLVLAVDDRRYRVKDLAPGEVALYDDEGQRVWLKRGRIVVTAPEVRLGSDSAAQFVALANLVDERFQQLAAVFDTWTPVAGDGGAALKLALTALMATPINWPATVAATKVKAE